MNDKTLRLIGLIVVLLALYAASCSSLPNHCATGEVPIGDYGIVCVCKPGHVPDDDGKGCHIPDPTTTTTTTTSTTLPPTTTTTLPPPTPIPPTPPPSACYPGPWRMHCKFASCEIQGEPSNPVFGAPLRAAVLVVSGPSRVLPEGDVITWARRIRDELRAKGFCAVAKGDPNARTSDDEVGVYHPNDPHVEHWDIAIATGGGQARIVPDDAHMVARGFK